MQEEVEGNFFHKKVWCFKKTLQVDCTTLQGKQKMRTKLEKSPKWQKFICNQHISKDLSNLMSLIRGN